MINYETFESSSEGEMDHGLFESAALSYQNRDKVTSEEKEAKRVERIKRKERKNNEKLKLKKEEERERRHRHRIKLKLEDIQRTGQLSSGLEELQDDVIMFRDSDRDSVVSYFRKAGAIKTTGLDTPTRILNNSNEFLPFKYSEALEQATRVVELASPKNQNLMTP